MRIYDRNYVYCSGSSSEDHAIHTIMHTHSTIYLPITDLAANWYSKLSMHIQIIIFPLLKGPQDYGNDITFCVVEFCVENSCNKPVLCA